MHHSHAAGTEAIEDAESAEHGRRLGSEQRAGDPGTGEERARGVGGASSHHGTTDPGAGNDGMLRDVGLPYGIGFPDGIRFAASDIGHVRPSYNAARDPVDRKGALG